MRARFIYENASFQRGADPKTSIGIGMSKKIAEDIEKFLVEDINKRHVFLQVEINQEGKNLIVVYDDLYGENISKDELDREKEYAWELLKISGLHTLISKSKGAKFYQGVGGIFYIYFTFEKPFPALENTRFLIKWGEDYDRGTFDVSKFSAPPFRHFMKESMGFIRGADPKTSMGIGKRALIDKWFAEYAPNVKYNVDDDLKIAVAGSLYLYGTPITELPEGLSVGGDLDLSGTAITELPEGLSVGGWLDLRGTAIRELPKSLRAKGSIYKDF
jgi:hypothetical protein